MKRTITLFFAILFTSSIFAQEKRINFTNKFTYQTVTKKNNDNTPFLEIFANDKEGLIATKPAHTDYYAPQYLFYDEEGMSWVSFGMNNHLIYYPRYYNYDYNTNMDIKPNYEIINLNNKEKVGDHQCNQYLFKYKNQYSTTDVDGFTNPDSYSALKVCIDDRNSANSNSNLLFMMTNTYDGINPYKNIFPKGLVVKIGEEKNYDTEYTMLTRSEKIAQTIYFDRKKEVEKETRYRDSIRVTEAKYDEAEKIGEAEIDPGKEPNEAVGTATEEVATNENSILPKYESAYKKDNPSGSNLAIDGEISENQKNALPRYCFRINAALPKFTNQKVAKHLKNYAGQICDMYLTQGENSSVYVKGTIDEIRREVVWLIKNREKLNKKDQKMVDQYLENLD